MKKGNWGAFTLEGLLKYQILADNANDIIIFATTEGKIIEANRAALLSYGYTEEEIIGRSIFELIRPDKNLPVRTNPFGAGGEGIYYEAVATRKDGSTFLVEASMQSAHIGDGKVLLSIQRDITERKQVEEELKVAMEHAEAANLAKSEFLANMSHEIRTPLNGMLGMIDLTLFTDLTKEQRDNLITAKDCASALLNIINDILDFSKIEARKLILEDIGFDFKEFIEMTLKPHRIKAKGKGLRLNYKAAGNVPKIVRGDPGRIKQVLNNLLGNAIKFTDHGGIDFSVRCIKRIEDLATLEFSVKDTGVGIAPNDIEYIFKTFTQADNSVTRKYGGSGLGLVISKQLVEMMGGTIEVESEVGRGSTFSFAIELGIGDTLNSTGDVKTNRIKSTDALQVLLVEDDRTNQIVIARLLKEAGHSVTTADNGFEALKVMEERHFDLVFMDIQMPKMDGIETVRRIRRKERLIGGERAIIIALTAYALQGDRERFLRAGMDDYVAKPVQIERLFETIERALAKRRDGIPGGMDTYDNTAYEYEGLETRNNNIARRTLGGIMLNTMLLKDVIKKRDMENAEKHAHQIRQLAAMAGENELKRIAFRLELATRKRDFVAVNRCLEEILQKVDKMKEILDNQ